MTETQDEQGADLVDLDERRWLSRHLAGDAGAFGELLQAYRRPVYAFLVRTGAGAAERDDLFQEIFLRIHAGAASYQPSRPLKPWLFTIVANTVRSFFRKQSVERRVLSPDAAPALADPGPGPERAASARERLAWLEAALGELSLAEREVVLLSSVEAMDQGQVSTALQIPVNTVKTHLRRARLRLAGALAEHERGKA